jgi:hypothetical protein
MTAAITTLRTTIATAITNAALWSTFAYPPSNILANSVIVAPADPYITPSNNSRATISPLANFKIIITVPMFDNEGNLQGIEETIVAVFNLLAASSIVFNVRSVSAPSVLSVASGDLLTADLQISVLTAWSWPMALTDEEKAFLIKIGQELPVEVKETKPKETLQEKDEA